MNKKSHINNKDFWNSELSAMKTGKNEGDVLFNDECRTRMGGTNILGLWQLQRN